MLVLTAEATCSRDSTIHIYWPRSLPPYSCKTLATYKSMVVLISGVFGKNFFGKEEVGGTLSKLNHIIKQSYNITILFRRRLGQSI